MFLYRFLYNSIIHIGKLVVEALAFKKAKAYERNKNKGKLLSQMPAKAKDEVRIWFHASSMGEFEQAKPIIEKIKTSHQQIQIFCSFYSPSGFLNQRDYQFADYIFYMLEDTKSYAEYSISKIQPDLVIFVRYDAWLNHLEVLNQYNIPVYLICATFPIKLKSPAFSMLKPIARLIYSQFDKIFTVGKPHSDEFRSMGVKSEIIDSGDTRLDRVISQVNMAKENPAIPLDFTTNVFTLVAGSTWEEDERILIEAVNKLNRDTFRIRCIIVPHEPTKSNIERLKASMNNSMTLSSIDLQNIEARGSISKNHIIVDSIGKLLFLYANGDCAYVGNGFGKCVHSTSEPAGYGIPIATGPNISSSPDASELNRLGALIIIRNADELYDWLKLMLENPTARKEQGLLALKFVTVGKGTADLIANDIMNIIDNTLFQDNYSKLRNVDDEK